MRRSVVALASVASGAVLVLSYRAGLQGGLGPAAVTVAPPPQQGTPSAPPSPAPAPTLPVAPTTAAAPARTTTPRAAAVPTTSAARIATHAPAPTTAAPPAVRAFTGGVAQTPYGPVQVQITVSAGRITAARTLQQPSGDPHSVSLASYAVPRLDQEAVAAQSASIDVVTGATYTSEGYIGSLQSALDAAHLR